MICRRRAVLISISIEMIGIALLATARGVLWLVAGRAALGVAIGASLGT